MPALPRRGRCLLPGVACHVTQRGVDRRETFSADQDRHTYLRLLRENLGDAQVSLLAWCLMSNHVHLVMVPAREDSLSILLRRVHGRYAQYYNACRGRSGHLWQNRYFGCMLEPAHLCPPVPPLLSRWENRAVRAVPFYQKKKRHPRCERLFSVVPFEITEAVRFQPATLWVPSRR